MLWIYIWYSNVFIWNAVRLARVQLWIPVHVSNLITSLVFGLMDDSQYRWFDKCLFTTNARDWFIDTHEWTTVLLYGSLHGLCIVAGVSKAHALTNLMRAQTARQNNNGYCYDVCAYCQAWRHTVTCHIIYRRTSYHQSQWQHQNKSFILRIWSIPLWTCFNLILYTYKIYA